MRPLGILGPALSGSPPVQPPVASKPSGLTLIAAGAPSSQATLDFVNVFTADFDAYKLVFSLLPVTNDVDLRFVFGTGTTPTWQAASYYFANNVGSGSGTYGDGQGAGFMGMLGTNNASLNGYRINNTAGWGIAGEACVFSPANTSRYKFMEATSAHLGYSTGTSAYCAQMGGVWASTAAITSLRLQFSSGNIASGTVRLYGISNS